MRIQKSFIAFYIIFGMASAAVAQISKSDIFDKTKSITWLGLDFSNTKLIGDREKLGSQSDVKFLIKSWNDLVEKEYERKFNVGRFFNKSNVDIKFDIARAHNEELDVSEMFSNDPKDFTRLKNEDIQTVLNTYDFQGLDGMGLIFIVESFSKLDQRAAIWVTYFDLNTKEIILTERMVEPPVGGTLRNYWAGSIGHVMEKVQAKQYNIWKKKYAP